MTLLYQPQARHVLLLVGFLALSSTAGCQSSRMAKVPGMGWLGSHKGEDAQNNSMTPYPAPSASAIPTTISDSRATGADTVAASQLTGPRPDEPSNQVASGVTYPETQHAGLPPAPAAAPRGQAPSNGYTSPAASQTANPGLAGAPPNGSPRAANLGDVQQGLYATANMSSNPNTWGENTENGRASGAYVAPGTAVWNHGAGGGPQSTTAPPSDQGALATRANSDFAPLYPSPTVPTQNPVTPAGYQAQAVAGPTSRVLPNNQDTTAYPAATPPAAEFARYEQGAAGDSSYAQQAVHGAPVAATSSFNATPGAAAATPTADSSYSSREANSHYAAIAADQAQGGRNGSWRPGSTSRFDAGATVNWQSHDATTATANSRTTSGGVTATPQGWD